MFANAFQSGFMSIFYSVGSNPLQLWDKQVKNGHIRRVVDDEVRSLVLEISGTNVATTYITCPIKPRLSLGIKLPFLVMIIKNMKKYFTFEIQILDDKDMHRRFRVSNFQSTTKVRPFCTTMPIGLSSGWNQVQFNLADFTKRAYGSTYLETTRVQIHANVRIRRIYFSDILYSDDELPNEYKLFLPTPGTQTAAKPSQLKKTTSQEKKDAKKTSASELPEPTPVEKEPPSGALPSPAAESPVEPPTESEPPSEPPSEPAESTAEPSSGGPTTAEPTTTELTEPASEPVEGGELPAEGAEAPAEGAEPPAEGAEPPAEGAEPAAEGAEPAVEGAEPAAEGAEPPAEGAKPAAEGEAAGEPTPQEPAAEGAPAEGVEESAKEAPPEEAAPSDAMPEAASVDEAPPAEVPAEETAAAVEAPEEAAAPPAEEASAAEAEPAASEEPAAEEAPAEEVAAEAT